MNMQGPTEKALLESTELLPYYESAVRTATFQPKIGFLMTGQDIIHKGANEMLLFGWANSAWQRGGTGARDVFCSIAEYPYDFLASRPEINTLNRHGKGTGARLYNTPQALCGAADAQETAGMYAVAIDLDRLDDRRAGMVRQYVRAGGLKAAAALFGDGQIISRVNYETADYDGILYNQTPDGKRYKRRRQIPDSPVPEQFMVVRRDYATFYKVGETALR